MMKAKNQFHLLIGTVMRLNKVADKRLRFQGLHLIFNLKRVVWLVTLTVTDIFVVIGAITGVALNRSIYWICS